MSKNCKWIVPDKSWILSEVFKSRGFNRRAYSGALIGEDLTEKSLLRIIEKLIDEFCLNEDSFDTFIDNCREAIYNVMKLVDQFANPNIKAKFSQEGTLSFEYISYPSIYRGAIVRVWIVQITNERAISKIERKLKED